MDKVTQIFYDREADVLCLIWFSDCRLTTIDC
jgi:hypothetical protein